MNSNYIKYEYVNSIVYFFIDEVSKERDSYEYFSIDFLVKRLKTLRYTIEKFLFSLGEKINLILIINLSYNYRSRLLISDGLDEKLANILASTKFLKYESKINQNFCSYSFQDDPLAKYCYNLYNEDHLSGFEYFSRIREVLKLELERLEDLKKIIGDQFYLIDTEQSYEIEYDNYSEKLLFLLEPCDATSLAEEKGLLVRVG